MKKIYDRETIEAYLQRIPHQQTLRQFQDKLFLIVYEKGEFVTAPFLETSLFQMVLEGSCSIYFVREDGEKYALSDGREGYFLGDMEIFHASASSIYTEATETLCCLALPIEPNRSQLLQDAAFLRLAGISLAEKMAAITAFHAEPSSLRERVLSYLNYNCQDCTIRGLEKAAFHLHCSARQLQRIMTKLEQEQRVEKIGKGSYRLLLK